MTETDLGAGRRDRSVNASITLVLLTAAGFLRIQGPFRAPLWLDEAYSAYASGNGFAFLWNVVPRYDTHPPVYYSLLRLWSLVFGDTLVGLRSLGLVCGLATLPAAALAGRELARALGLSARRIGLAAMALAAFAPLLIDMSRQVRPYPVMILVYAIGLGAMLRLGRIAGETGEIAPRPFALYLLCLELTLWLHNLGPLFGASLTIGLLVLLAGRTSARTNWKLLLGGHAIVAIAYLPGLLMLLDQAPTWVTSTWLGFGWQGLHWRIAALWGAVSGIAIVAMAMLGSMGIASMVRRGGGRIAGALLVAALAPPAAAIALSLTVAPVFLVRTMTPIGIPALLIMAVGAGAPPGKWRWAATVAAVIMLAQMIVVDVQSRRIGPKEDWYGAVRWLEQRFRPGDVVYAYPNEGALPFDRAAGDLGLAMPSRPIPTAVPALGVGGWNPSGSRGVVSLPRERLRAIAEEPETRMVPTIYLLRLGPWTHDKGDVFLGELASGRVETGRWRSGPIDIVALTRADIASRALSNRAKEPPATP